MREEAVVYVIGHKNPDTDSICSAISYAELKNLTSFGVRYIPKRAGQINEETEYVLKRLGVEPPGYMPDAGTQVKDMEIHEMPPANDTLTIKEAWELMMDAKAASLPITDSEGRLEGIIGVGDIAKYFMGNSDESILSKARTQYKRMAETLDGKLVLGNEHGYFIKGRVVIGTDDPKLLASNMLSDDLVVLGNRKDTQLAAIKADASCLVISGGNAVEPDVIEAAKKKSCVIIESPMDTYTIATLISHSIPVKYLMKCEGIVTFHSSDFTDEIKDTMGKYRYRDFPVVDADGRCLGTISRRNLINVRKKQIILVDHNERTQTVDNIEEADILEIIDHHRIGSLETISPIMFRNQPVGCTATIVYQMYNEKGVEIPKKIAGLLTAAILSDTLMFRSPTCTKFDQEAVNVLSEIAGIDIEDFANDMFMAGSNLSGKKPEEIFYQDFKKFMAGETTFGVGQINSMDAKSLANAEEKIKPILQGECGKNGMSMVFFMLTNILEESTRLLCFGEGSAKIVEKAFDVKAYQDVISLKGIVSRKKQFIPTIMGVFNE